MIWLLRWTPACLHSRKWQIGVTFAALGLLAVHLQAPESVALAILGLGGAAVGAQWHHDVRFGSDSLQTNAVWKGAGRPPQT